PQKLLNVSVGRVRAVFVSSGMSTWVSVAMGPSVFNAASERMDALVHAAMAVIVNATAAAIPMVLCIFPSHVRIASVPWVANLGRNGGALCEGGHRTTILMDYLCAGSRAATHHPEVRFGSKQTFYSSIAIRKRTFQRGLAECQAKQLRSAPSYSLL